MRSENELVLVGLAGPAGSGKDTAADMLERVGYHRYAFADPVKECCAIITNEPVGRYYDQEAKRRCPEGWSIPRRKIIQLMGTEAGREIFGWGLWTWRAESEWEALLDRQPILGNETLGMVVTDVRFENEAAMIRENGGYVIHIKRPGCDGLAETRTLWERFRAKIGLPKRHVSEAGVEVRPEQGDLVVHNDRSGTASLHHKMMRLLKESGLPW